MWVLQVAEPNIVGPCWIALPFCVFPGWQDESREAEQWSEASSVEGSLRGGGLEDFVEATFFRKIIRWNQCLKLTWGAHEKGECYNLLMSSYSKKIKEQKENGDGRWAHSKVGWQTNTKQFPWCEQRLWAQYKVRFSRFRNHCNDLRSKSESMSPLRPSSVSCGRV